MKENTTKLRRTSLTGWQLSGTVSTRQPVEQVQAAVGRFFSDRGAGAPPAPSRSDGKPFVIRGEYEASGRLWIRVAATCTVSEDGPARVVAIDLESRPVLAGAAFVVAAFVVMILAAGALEIVEVARFETATLAFLAGLHWIGAGLVLRREMRALSRRIADRSVPRG
jgi:hypothetical protein